MGQNLWSIEDICNYLGLSRDTIYDWIDKGLPIHHLGCSWKFKKQDVDTWLDKNAK